MRLKIAAIISGKRTKIVHTNVNTKIYILTSFMRQINVFFVKYMPSKYHQSMKVLAMFNKKWKNIFLNIK